MTNLNSDRSDFWLIEDRGQVLGFMGMHPHEIESLFRDPPPHFRRGLGSRFIAHAQARFDELTVDVNEENRDAHSFYASRGFVVVGRSDRDAQGQPHPLVHLCWTQA